MQFTQETDYALRLIAAFCRLPEGSYRQAREIADRETIPFRFLLRILGKLKAAGIMASRQGVDGGYRLARTPQEITLRAVVEAMEGKIFINRCLRDSALCNAGNVGHCGVHKALCSVQETLLRALDSHTFAGMGRRPRRRKGAPTASPREADGPGTHGT